MPIYGFRCECGRTEEHYFPLREQNPTARCEECGRESARDLTVESRNHIPASAFPFVTKNLNGKPIEVRSEAHLQELSREFGVNHRPDAAFLEKSYQGVDWRTGKQVYKEGRGVGSPGCWV